MSAYFAGRPASSISRSTLSAALLLLTSAIAFGQGFPQDNVSTGGLTPAGWLDAGNPLKQMNEPDCAVTPGRPNVVVCGMNDYSGVDPNSLDVPAQPFEARSIGDSSAGIAMSTDGGRRWIRGLHPCHFADTGCLMGQKYMADPNLSAAPGVLFYSVMAGYRDGTAPGGLFMFTWLENNTEVGQPYIFNKFDQIAEGTGGSGPGGKFLDKPGQTESLAAPGTPPVIFQAPDPNNPGMTVPVEVPAGSIHFVYSVFVGNDNNPGTKIIYNRYDNWDFSGAAFTTKLTEGSEINQGASIATSANGTDTMIVWRRFKDNNEEASIMYATCNLTKCSKPKLLADFCPHDQTTGRARYRMLALPVVTRDDNNWHVFYSDRGDGNTTCFDSNGVANVNANGVPAQLDYSRVMMATWDGKGNNANWNIQPVDPQLADASGKKIKGHQVQPATTTANGVVQVIWDDTRDSRLYPIIDSAFPNYFSTNVGIDRFIEDYVRSDEGLLPARFYEPDGVGDEELQTGTPFRHSIDVWGKQIVNGVPGDSFKVSRYAVGRSPFSGNVEQLEHSLPNGRMFRQGTRPFYADYKTVAAAAFRLNENDEWESNAGESTGAISNFPVFYAGFTDNRRVRGDVYYDGCNESTDSCANTYEIPNKYTPPTALAPLVGEEDPSIMRETCGVNPANPPRALSRNQKVFVAPIRPGLALSVVSARKPQNSAQDRTFVLYLQNSAPTEKTVTLSVPGSGLARWNRVKADPPELDLHDIDVTISRHTGAVRTLFVSGDPDGIIVTATDNGTGDVVKTLINGNVDLPLENFNGVLAEEDYTLRFLGERVVSTKNQDLENQDLENTVFLQDLENLTLLQDLENTSILQDLENQDLENLLYEAQDLENQDLENEAVLQDLENRSLFFQDLENQDLENQDLENDGYDAQDLENRSLYFQDLENQDLENQDLENQDLENGAPYTEISWSVDPESNTTVGINAKVIAAAGTTDDVTTQVFVTQSYLTHTVTQNPDAAEGQFCTPQVVADNQVIYNTIINGPLDNNVADEGLDPEVISFYAEPGVPTTVTVRIYHLRDPNFNPRNVGLAVYSQAGEPDCTPEVGGTETIAGCEVDFEPDTTPPVLSGFPEDPIDDLPFKIAFNNTVYPWVWGGTVIDEDPTTTVECFVAGLPVEPAGSAAPPLFEFSYDFPVGSTEVTCTASDSSDNIVTATFNVTTVDLNAPEFMTPPVTPISFDATGAFTPISDIDLGLDGIEVTDAFEVTITNDAPQNREPPDLRGFPIGPTTVTWTATDANGNESTATQVVTLVDEPPILTVIDFTISTTESTITVDYADYIPDKISATDVVDDDLGVDIMIDCTPTVLSLGANTGGSCTATDSSGKEDTKPLTVTVELSYIVEIDPPKGNIRAGSTVPMDFRYYDSADPTQTIDSSGFTPSATWAEFADLGSCNNLSDPGVNLDSSEDSGNSFFRYTPPTWQYSWQTPAEAAGSYLRFTVMPPDTPTAESFVCVRVR